MISFYKSFQQNEQNAHCCLGAALLEIFNVKIISQIDLYSVSLSSKTYVFEDKMTRY